MAAFNRSNMRCSSTLEEGVREGGEGRGSAAQGGSNQGHGITRGRECKGGRERKGARCTGQVY